MNQQLPFTIIVSGLPRSGTSLMMQMLQAGGIPILSDGIRQPDEDNPLGYLEWEQAKQLRSNPDCLDSSCGKAVKLIHLLLTDLPSTLQCRVIFMRRDLAEVLESQEKMLERNGKRGPNISREELAKAYTQQIDRVLAGLSSSANIRLLEVAYSEILADAELIAWQVQDFLECELDRNAMRMAVDPRLYRSRAKPIPTLDHGDS